MTIFIIMTALILSIGIGNWYLNEKVPEIQVRAVLKEKKKISNG